MTTPFDLRKQDDESSRKHWRFVEAVVRKLKHWPQWKQAAVRVNKEREAPGER